MRVLAALVAVSVVCLSAGPADASEWSLEKWAKRESAWKGHGVGSSYTETTTQEIPGMPQLPPNMPDIPGMPKGGKMVTTTKTTLSKITKDAYVLTVETNSNGRKTTRTETEPKVRTVKLTGQVKDGGEEALTVDGKSYTCRIKLVANMDLLMGEAIAKGAAGKKMRPRLSQGKVWEHPKLGVLKMETSTSMMGQSVTMTWQVKRLAVRHTIGKQAFTCREMTMTSKHQMGTSTVTMLSNRTFPGGTLKNVVKSGFGGRKMTIETLVTAYVKKPLTATTPAAKK